MIRLAKVRLKKQKKHHDSKQKKYGFKLNKKRKLIQPGIEPGANTWQASKEKIQVRDGLSLDVGEAERTYLFYH